MALTRALTQNKQLCLSTPGSKGEVLKLSRVPVMLAAACVAGELSLQPSRVVLAACVAGEPVAALLVGSPHTASQVEE